MADRKRATGGGEREGMMCDVLIFGARTPGYDSDPSDYADAGRTKSSRSRDVETVDLVWNAADPRPMMIMKLSKRSTHPPLLVSTIIPVELLDA